MSHELVRPLRIGLPMGRLSSLSHRLAHSLDGYAAWVGGAFEKGPRSVILKPVNLVFTGEELQLR